jgi:hypothetical protein
MSSAYHHFPTAKATIYEVIRWDLKEKTETQALEQGAVLQLLKHIATGDAIAATELVDSLTEKINEAAKREEPTLNTLEKNAVNNMSNENLCQSLLYTKWKEVVEQKYGQQMLYNYLFDHSNKYVSRENCLLESARCELEDQRRKVDQRRTQQKNQQLDEEIWWCKNRIQTLCDGAACVESGAWWYDQYNNRRAMVFADLLKQLSREKQRLNELHEKQSAKMFSREIRSGRLVKPRINERIVLGMLQQGHDSMLGWEGLIRGEALDRGKKEKHPDLRYVGGLE